MKFLIPSLILLLAGCSSMPKPEPVTLHCGAEQLYDFAVRTNSRNYWVDFVSVESLKSCRKHDYQPHDILVLKN